MLESKKTQFKLDISNRISSALKSKNLKKKELALMMKKSNSEISRWFSGTHNFTLDTIIEIEHHLNIDLLNPKPTYCNPCNVRLTIQKTSFK